MPLTRIVLIGATSTVGSSILTALSHASPPLSITVLLRPTSKPIPSYPNTRTVTVPFDTQSPTDLAASLTGYDTLICTFKSSSSSTLDLQLRLADACVAAGVRRYVLPDFGSVASDDPVVAELVPLFWNKNRVREHCQRLAAENQGRFSWTSLVTGHFFEHGLSTELLGFNLRKGTVKLYDGGKGMWSASTMGQIGRAVLAVVRKEEETAGEVLYVQSFCVSQLEVLEAVEAAREGKELERSEVGAEKYLKEMKKEMDGGNSDALEQVVGVLGITRARWDGKERFANELLGLKGENLRKVVSGVCEEIFGQQ